MTRQRALGSRLHINARLVRERDRARARELRRLVLYGAAIVVPLLVYVWQRVDFIRISYRVEALQKQKQELQEIDKRATLERSLLMAPDRIERVARKQLGLVDPHPEDVRRVTLTDGKIDEVGGPVAEGAPAAPRRAGRGFAAASAAGLPLTAPREEAR